MKNSNLNEDNYEIIFRPYITLKNGVRLYAYQYGKKAFAIKIPKAK